MIKITNFNNIKSLEIDGHERKLATGNLYIAPCSPGGKEGDYIDLRFNAANFLGNISAIFPSECPNGRYVIYSKERDTINKVGHIFVGKKPSVEVSLTPYKKYRNKNLFKMDVNFKNVSVVLGRDFGVCVDGKELSVPSSSIDAANHFSFLVTPEDNVSVVGKNDIEEYIDLTNCFINR